MCRLRAVTASHGHRQADDFAAPFETGLGERSGDEVREKRI